LDVACRSLARPGNTVIVERPTYFLAEHIFVKAGLTVVPAPTDGDGLQVWRP
jgi:2-aminoadipate transaminase